jgi:hypothetical protein
MNLSRSSFVVLAFAAVFALAVLLTARRMRTTERHTFTWLAVCFVIAALAVWRQAIDEIAAAMGIFYPPSALFFGALAVLLWLVYRVTLSVAEQRQQLKRLAQEVALLSAEHPREDAPPR